MSYNEFDIPLPTAGIHAEINPNELPPNALSDALNWILRDGRMRVRAGLTAFAGDTAGRPNGMVGYRDDDGSAQLFMATTTTPYRFDEATQAWVALTGTFTAGVPDHTVFRVYQQGSAGGVSTTVYGTNGVDDVFSWTLGDAAIKPTMVAASAGTAPRAKAMMVLADRMLLGNLVAGNANYTGAIGPMMVAVSNSQDPTTGWNTVLINPLADTPGEIVAMQEIGNLQGVIYKTDAIYLATASGSANPFTFELKKAGCSGPVSPRAVVVGADGLQYYLARDGNVMVFDGILPKPLGRHIQRYVLDTWDVNISSRAHGVYDSQNNELTFFYCSVATSEPDYKIVIRLDDTSLWPGAFDTLRITAAVKTLLPGGTKIGSLGISTIADLTKTLGEYDSLGESFLYMDSTGQAYREGGTTDAGGPITAFFETGTTSLGNALLFKSLRYIDYSFSTTAAEQFLTMTISKTNYGEDLIDDDVREMDLSLGGPYRTFHRFPARGYSMRFDVLATQDVEYQGATATYALQGRR